MRPSYLRRIFYDDLFLLIFCLFSCSESINLNSEQEMNSVKTYMQEQENAWNEGDLNGFMKHYWKSDSLRFIGKSGLNYGWQKTLDNYKKSETIALKNKSINKKSIKI